jgi:pyruvate dehydrogenase complex dihydrolipoamide acetyltransferase long form
MVFEYKLPDIGEGLTEGEIVKWLVKEGDAVTEDQPIVEVMTDKATVELPAPRTGTIKKILAQEGEVIPVGKVFVTIEEGGAAKTEPAKPEAKKEPKQSKKAEPEEQKEEEPEEKEEKMLFESSSPTAGGSVSARRSRQQQSQDGGNGGRPSKILAAPAVRRMAREKDVDLAQVQGSGPQGRITRSDLEEYLENGGSTVQVQDRTASPRAAPQAVAVSKGREEERVPIRGVRRVIADAMARSKRTAAHFTYVEEVDCTNLVALREKAKHIAKEQHGISMTFLPFIIKATVAALKQVPLVNSAYDETTQEIVYRKYYDIGIAVATEPGLIVPVIRDADKKDMFTLQKEMADLSERTRQGKAKPDELRGSTFTITSLGKTGGVLATPIINYPEVAIMGVHEIKDKPVIRKAEDGTLKVVPGKLMNLSFSFDHRIVDGAVGADFAQRIVRYLENPELLLLEA